VIIGGKLGIFAFQAPQKLLGVDGSSGRDIGTRALQGLRP
jgi:hypothetical protein